MGFLTSNFIKSYSRQHKTLIIKKIKTSYTQFQNELSTQPSKSISRKKFYGVAAGLVLPAIGYYYYVNFEDRSKPAYALHRPGLPTYKSSEISKHSNWVTLGSGVYDISNYKKQHPGGEETISLAAGGSLETFWDKYAFHNKDYVIEVLESLRVGNLEKDAKAQHRCKKPRILPKVDPETYRLEISFGDTLSRSLKLNEIKKDFPKHSISSEIPCKVKEGGEAPPKGPVWSGVLLSDVLRKLGFDTKEYHGLQFECLDKKGSSSNGFCLPIKKVTDPDFKILLAYEMNGLELSPEHGYPIRVVMPQLPGSQNVKWLSKVYFVKKDS